MKGQASYIVTLVYLAALISLGWFIPREQFGVSLMAYMTMVIGMWMYGLGNTKVEQLITLGVVFRLIAVFTIPELSDDIYRFVWDGLVSSNGINPYEFTPREIVMMGGGDLAQGSIALFPLLNSPDYHTVYPPVIQALNLSAVWISGGETYFTIIYLKLAVALADIGSILIFARIVSLMKLNSSLSIALIALNPLFIMEVSANGHHEGFILFFISATFYTILRSRFTVSGLLLGIAIGIKLTPLILAPVIVAYLAKKGGAARFISGTLISSCILLFPLADPVIREAMTESTGLYFKTFAFNSPVHHLAAWGSELSAKPWEVMETVNMVTPLLSVAGILLIAFFVYRDKVTVVNGMLWTMACYLIFSRVIHPWYLVPLSGFAVISGNIPLLAWGNLAFLSYSAYSMAPYKESKIALAVEYTVLLVLIMISAKQSANPSRVHSETL